MNTCHDTHTQTARRQEGERALTRVLALSGIHSAQDPTGAWTVRAGHLEARGADLLEAITALRPRVDQQLERIGDLLGGER